MESTTTQAPPAAGSARSDDALEARSEPLGGSALSVALQRGTAPAGWLAAPPATTDTWRERLEAIRQQFSAGAWLELLAPALDASGAAADRLATVAGGAGVVVTTGQQPGLFGGPLYTWSKALSALALADELQRATGVPVAPVFWAATDDADFGEASRTVVAAPRGAAELRARATAPDGTPMSVVPIGDDVAAMLDILRGAAGSAAYPSAIAAAERAYVTGATVGGAYVALLRELLEPLGIAVLDASHPAAREAAFHTLRRALLQSAEIERALAAREAELRDAGFAPQVEPVAGLSLVFRQDVDGRKARVPVSEARGLVARVKHEELGPNVLLRPVAERAMLPTAAYVAGPGELAYFAQVSAVAEALGAAPPVAVPRWSCTVIEPHVRRALARLGVAPETLREPQRLATQLARAQLPPAVRAELDALRAVATDGLASLAAADSASGDAPLVPPSVVDGAARALAHHLDRLERRYVAAVKRRDTATARDLATAAGALYPLGSRQERALNALPMLARHGHALWDAMLAGARAHAAALVEHTSPPG